MSVRNTLCEFLLINALINKLTKFITKCYEHNQADIFAVVA